MKTRVDPCSSNVVDMSEQWLRWWRGCMHMCWHVNICLICSHEVWPRLGFLSYSMQCSSSGMCATTNTQCVYPSGRGSQAIELFTTSSPNIYLYTESIHRRRWSSSADSLETTPTSFSSSSSSVVVKRIYKIRSYQSVIHWSGRRKTTEDSKF